MSMKKSVKLLPYYATSCTNYSIATSSLSQRCWRQPSSSCRGYATIRDTQSQPHDNERTSSPKLDPHFWPTAKPPRTVPTPYEILQVHPRAKYIKTARFYELVKLYHPDRHDNAAATSTVAVARSVRLERYRLVVDAHALLSDPEKRRAYDLYGAGWSGSRTLFPPPDFNMNQEAREACMNNATWQDWENWYDKFNPPKPGDPPRKPQAPVYLSNAAFISLVGILAALAGVGQATRAHESSKNYVYMVDAVSNKNKGEVNQVQQTKQGLNREQRIDYFLRDRDPEAYVDEDVKKLSLNADAASTDETNAREDLTRRYR